MSQNMLDKFWCACSVKASVNKVTDSHDSMAIWSQPFRSIITGFYHSTSKMLNVI